MKLACLLPPPLLDLEITDSKSTTKLQIVTDCNVILHKPEIILHGHDQLFHIALPQTLEYVNKYFR